MGRVKQRNVVRGEGISTIKQCFAVILDGDRESSRLAARLIRKLVYGRDDKGTYADFKQQIDNAPKYYAAIKEDWRQENFVMAISVIYFLHDHEDEPDFLFPWLFELLEHERGAIRHAAVRMLEHEIGPLTVHIRCPEEKFGQDHITPARAETMLLAMYLVFNHLLSKYAESKYRRYKYISSLPSGPYKSIQMVLGRMDEDCGEGYLAQLAKSYKLKSHRRT